MALVNGLPSVILNNVAELIRKKVPVTTAPLVEEFSKLLYGNISTLDLKDRNDSDMYGATLSLWNALNEHNDKNPVINIFNPQVSKHGWKSNHTIIEVIVRDMPFLVDSLRIALARLGVTPHLMLNCPIKIVRDKSKKIEKLSPASDKKIKETTTETVFFIEVDRIAEQSVIDDVVKELESVLSDISLTVNDWKPIKDKLSDSITTIKKSKYKCSKEDHNETLEFLNWIINDNFTLMGYRSFDLKAVKGDVALIPKIETSLGLMKRNKTSEERYLSELSEDARELATGDNLLILTKTNSRSRVHRPAHLDHIGIKRFDAKGNVVGEDRFVGLFGSAYYTNSALDLPLIKSKVAAVCE